MSKPEQAFPSIAFVSWGENGKPSEIVRLSFRDAGAFSSMASASSLQGKRGTELAAALQVSDEDNIITKVERFKGYAELFSAAAEDAVIPVTDDMMVVEEQAPPPVHRRGPPPKPARRPVSLASIKPDQLAEIDSSWDDVGEAAVSTAKKPSVPPPPLSVR